MPSKYCARPAYQCSSFTAAQSTQARVVCQRSAAGARRSADLLLLTAIYALRPRGPMSFDNLIGGFYVQASSRGRRWQSTFERRFEIRDRACEGSEGELGGWSCMFWMIRGGRNLRSRVPPSQPFRYVLHRGPGEWRKDPGQSGFIGPQNGR